MKLFCCKIGLEEVKCFWIWEKFHWNLNNFQRKVLSPLNFYCKSSKFIVRSTHVSIECLSINNSIFFVTWQICENNKSFPLDMLLLFQFTVIYPSPPIFIFILKAHSRAQKKISWNKTLSMSRTRRRRMHRWLPHVIPCNISRKCEHINQHISICSPFLSPETFVFSGSCSYLASL